VTPVSERFAAPPDTAWTQADPAEHDTLWARFSETSASALVSIQQPGPRSV